MQCELSANKYFNNSSNGKNLQLNFMKKSENLFNVKRKRNQLIMSIEKFEGGKFANSESFNKLNKKIMEINDDKIPSNFENISNSANKTCNYSNVNSKIRILMEKKIIDDNIDNVLQGFNNINKGYNHYKENVINENDNDLYNSNANINSQDFMQKNFFNNDGISNFSNKYNNNFQSSLYNTNGNDNQKINSYHLNNNQINNHININSINENFMDLELLDKENQKNFFPSKIKKFN